MYGESSKDETREFLVAIRDEAVRLGRLVDDFLAQARIEGGDLEFEVVEFPLGDLLKHFGRLFEGPAARRGIRLDCRIDADLPPAVGDPERVSQVLANLLSNATKFTPEGGVVSLTAHALPAEAGQVLGKVLVEVTDTGPGIEEQDRERIFERFVRIDHEPAAPKGAGLGLPIARSLVEHLGGRLWCDGRLRGGAVFRFTLPALVG
jgi:signal transduction histidine kinase